MTLSPTHGPPGHRRDPTRPIRISILHHVGLEDAPERFPALAIEAPVGSEAVGSGICHVKGMMGVVVREETLTTEREQIPDRVEILVDLVEYGSEPLAVDRIGVPETAGRQEISIRNRG